MKEEAGKCAVCHTQQSCVACHVGSPASVQPVPTAGPGRGPGADDPAGATRQLTGSTSRDSTPSPPRPVRRTAAAAMPAPSACPAIGPTRPSRRPGYHPAGFLTTHPAAAYSRESSCSECHNQGEFCANCHLNAGLVSSGRLRGTGYHDAKQSFLLNHGQAARQSLETCTSCHAERDCLTCHSATGSRRFNPHGPGFDPGRSGERTPRCVPPVTARTFPSRDARRAPEPDLNGSSRTGSIGG